MILFRSLWLLTNCQETVFYLKLLMEILLIEKKSIRVKGVSIINLFNLQKDAIVTSTTG
jgi:hypothetical protein